MSLRGLLQRQLDFLARPEVFRLQMLWFLRITSLSLALNKQLRIIYRSRPRRAGALAGPGPERRASADPEEERQMMDDPMLNPRYIMLAFRSLDVYRVFTSFWLAYVVARRIVNDNSELVRSMLPVQLALPMHCYVPGIWQLHESFSEALSPVIAALHLIWRAYQCGRPPYRLSVVTFAFLSRRDLEATYARLDERQSIQLTLHEHEHLSERSRSILTCMCHRVDYQTKFVYRLRYNRTRDWYDKLRDMGARLGYTCLVALVLNTLIITTGLVIYLLNDHTYMRLYPNCEPALERARAAGQLADYSITMTLHRWYTGFCDGVTNAVMYLEGATVIYAGTTCIILMNVDLMRQWTGIDQKINRVYRLMSEASLKRMAHIERRTIIGKSAGFQRDLSDLLGAMSDFFSDVKHADEIISTFLMGVLIACLLLCALITYFMRVSSQRELPAQIILVVSLMLVWVLSAAYGFLAVHRYCMNSYWKFCAIMARDLMKQEHNYQAIMDFFTNKRSCFTVMKQVPFQPTTFITMIGWTASCFFVISGLLRDNERLAALAKLNFQPAASGART